MVGAFAGAVAERYDLFGFLGTRPSLPTQIDDVRRVAAEQGLHTSLIRRADLHGTGGSAILMVFRDADAFFGDITKTRSDDLRIYDVDDEGDLRLAFRFRPSGAGRLTPDYVFRIDTIADLDGNGRPEIIGAWEMVAMGPVLPRPVAVVWEEARSRYVMYPLLRPPKRSDMGFGFNPSAGGRPPLVPASPPGGYAAGLRRFYVQPTTLKNDFDATSLASYAVEGFYIRRTPEGRATLVAGYIVQQRRHIDIATVEVLGWPLELIPEPSVPAVCGGGPGARLFFRLGPRRIEEELRRAWESRADRFC